MSRINQEKYGKPWQNWFLYDETSPSGLRWKEDRKRGRGYGQVFIAAGTPAGYLYLGYYYVNVEGANVLVHRVIWEIHNGPLKEGLIVDHLDGNKSNNKLSNLQAKSCAENTRNKKMRCNNKSGICGVHFSEQFNAFVARWSNLDGSRGTKSFSVKTHGKDRAFELAVACRQEKLLELQQLGANYTPRHGTKE